MDTTYDRISSHRLTEAQLVDLLHSQEDRLERQVVDDGLSLGERAIWRLTDLCRDERSWTQTGSAQCSGSGTFTMKRS